VNTVIEPGDQRPTQIRSRLFWPLSLSLLLLAILFASTVFILHTQHSAEAFERELHYIQHDFESELMHHGNDLVIVSRRIIELSGFEQALWRAGEVQRNEILREHPKLSYIRKQRHIEHLTLYSPQGGVLASGCLLDETAGQIKENPLLTQAMASQHPATGLRVGRCGALVLSHVTPWYDATGELLGYLELATFVSRFIEHMQANYDFQGLLAIDKGRVSQGYYQRHQALEQLPDEWARHPQHLIIWESPDLPGEITSLLHDSLHEHSDAQHLHQGVAWTVSERVTLNGKHYLLSQLHLQDAGQQELGKLLLLRDISASQAQLERVVATVMGVTLLTSLLLFWLFSRLLSRIERDLSNSHDALLTQSRQLAERVDELERFQRVTIGRELRMKELKEQNRSLKSALAEHLSEPPE